MAPEVPVGVMGKADRGATVRLGEVVDDELVSVSERVPNRHAKRPRIALLEMLALEAERHGVGACVD
jgi:hypothetical protein